MVDTVSLHTGDSLVNQLNPRKAPAILAPMIQNPKIAFLGAGNMAEALVAGIVQGKLTTPDCLFATDISQARLAHLKDRYHVQVGSKNSDAILWAIDS